MLADFMLDDILSHLQNIEKTDKGIQVMLHMIATSPPLRRMFKCFLHKIKSDHMYLSGSSNFQKRILLFCMAHHAMLGETTDLLLMAEKLTPLEAALVRLREIFVAFDFVDQDSEKEFMEVWIQTIKQAILVFLKDGKYSEAEKVISVYDDKMKESQRLLLSRIIKHCLMKEDSINKILEQPGHSYYAYYMTMAKFIEGLNKRLDETTLAKLGRDYDRKEQMVNSDDGSDERPGPSLDNIENKRKESFEDESDGKESDSDRLLLPAVSESDVGSNDESDSNVNSAKESEDALGPKISLSYRIKKHNSGIIIPCKYIAQHCQKLNDDIEDADDQGHFQMPAPVPSNKPMMSTPQKTVNPVRKPKISGPRHRRILLGDRFENASTVQSTSVRSYSSKKKTLYSIETDAFIAEGCLQLGVGNWACILKSFPFPPNYTNTKIKDRFRSLIAKNYIALLDDGDISITNRELKSKLAGARKKIIPLKKQNQKHYSGGSIRSSSKTSSRLVTRQRPQPHVEAHTREVAAPSKSRNLRPQRIVSSPEGSLVLSNSDESSIVTKEIDFLPMEDAYLVCGAMNLGMRWDAIKEYMNFRPHITVGNMQDRWDALLHKGSVEFIDGHVSCVDSNLERMCEDVTRTLKNKIMNRRKSAQQNVDATKNTDDVEDADSVILLRKKRKRKIVAESEDADVEPAQFEEPSPVKKSSQLNKSIDAGTQTTKPRIMLRNKSPSILEGFSNSSASNSSGKSSLKLPGGSPVRPSMINLFKEKRAKTGLRPQSSSQAKGLRQRRQRELARMQRRGRTQKKAWTRTEITVFMELLHKHGPGKWSQILDDGYDTLKDRTSVMLKDKFRNLLKHGQIPTDLEEKWEARKADQRTGSTIGSNG